MTEINPQRSLDEALDFVNAFQPDLLDELEAIVDKIATMSAEAFEVQE
jgi:hypothetical protein